MLGLLGCSFCQMEDLGEAPLKSMQLTCTKQTSAIKKHTLYTGESAISFASFAPLAVKGFALPITRDHPIHRSRRSPCSLCVPSCPLWLSFFFRPDRPRLPVIAQRQQSQPESTRRTHNS